MIVFNRIPAKHYNAGRLHMEERTQFTFASNLSWGKIIPPLERLE